MKIYIMTDLEGVAGVASDAQVNPGNDPAYKEACRWLTHEVNAAVAGAIAGGAEEVIVNDGHAGGGNFLLDELDPRGKYIWGRPKPVWLPLLDRSVDAVFILGHHAMAGTAYATRDHTQSAAAWFRFTLNGREMGEIGQVAALAGEVGVPVALLTGDNRACDEARKLLGKVETVEVKKALSRECILTVPPQRARVLIQAGAERAVRRLREFKPLRIRPPFTATVEYTLTKYADGLKDISGRKRIGPRKVQFKARTIKGVFALL